MKSVGRYLKGLNISSKQYVFLYLYPLRKHLNYSDLFGSNEGMYFVDGLEQHVKPSKSPSRGNLNSNLDMIGLKQSQLERDLRLFADS